VVKTSFEVKIQASGLDDAVTKAKQNIASFLGVSEDEAFEHTDAEFKVISASDSGVFEVILFANVKRGK
jgi:hypothetical protein